MLLIEARKNRRGGVQDSIFKVRAHSVEGVYVVKTKWQRRVWAQALATISPFSRVSCLCNERVYRPSPSARIESRSRNYEGVAPSRRQYYTASQFHRHSFPKGLRPILCWACRSLQEAWGGSKLLLEGTMRKKLLERLSWNERGQSRANTDQVMDEQIEKKNKLLEEDPDDFDTKSSLFTDESKVRMQWNSKATERVCKLFLLFR